MTNFEDNAVKQRRVRDFLGSALFIAMAATCAEASAQTNESPNNDTTDKNKSGLKYDLSGGVANITAVTLEENGQCFYTNVEPHVEGSIDFGKGFAAKGKAMELLIYDSNSKEITPILTTFMLELNKQMKDGGEFFLKMGRENTQGGDVFPNSIKRMAEDYIVALGNSQESAAIGFRKNGNSFEGGLAWDTGTGKFIICPPKDVDAWAKMSISILKNCGIDVALQAAARWGENSKKGIAGATITTQSGLGVKALFERDFKNNDNMSLVRVYQNLKNGSQVVGELVKTGKGKGLDIGLGYGAKGAQVFAKYNTETKVAQIGGSYSFDISKPLIRSGTRGK